MKDLEEIGYASSIISLIKKNGSQILTLLKTAQNIFLLGKTKYIYKKKRQSLIVDVSSFLGSSCGDHAAGMFKKLS